MGQKNVLNIYNIKSPSHLSPVCQVPQPSQERLYISMYTLLKSFMYIQRYIPICTLFRTKTSEIILASELCFFHLTVNPGAFISI